MVGARRTGPSKLWLLGEEAVLCLSSTNTALGWGHLSEETLGALRSVSRGVRWEKAEVSVGVQLK